MSSRPDAASRRERIRGVQIKFLILRNLTRGLLSAKNAKCRILELVRTAFAACGGEEVPPRKSGKAAPASTRRLGEAGEPHR